MHIFSRYTALALILIAAATVNCFGQTYLGISFGLNNSSFSGDAPEKISYGFTSGFIAGVLIDFELTKDVFMNIQPSYKTGGGVLLENDSVDSEIVYEYPVVNRSISLPVIVKAYAKSRLHFHTGFNVDYLLSSKATIRGTESDFKSELDDWNLAVIFGLGYIQPFANSRLGIDLQYVQGLSVVSQPTNEDTFIPRVRINNIRLVVSYQFKLKKGGSL